MTVRTKPETIKAGGPAITRRTGWRALLFWAAFGDMVVLLLVGIAHLDQEALSFAGFFLVGLGILFFISRTGWILPGILGLLFLDVEFWMLTASVSNLRNHEPVLFILEPLALSALSLAGVIAAAASIVTRRQAEAGKRAAPLVGLAAVAAFIVAFAAAAAFGWGKEQTRGPDDLVVTMHNVAYSTTSLKPRSGQVTVYVNNEDLFWHTFTIDQLGVDLQVPVGSHHRVTFTGAPATYTYYCRIPGHLAAGMKGTITIP
jgi:plastocyanin